ncbi:hypothetical protein [Jeotgalibacillus campisalis]|uniref:Uncharacterized protein n=1 Tax=Jeotgalibacillus campisalis TaxID=220754 RepID=A0A0C2SFV7_9BACL|nr:hypothetical protein [Jeotgalibacillus campisalis]KIL52814.1 hypothetical protein KR50_01430 [Jeotgalibacillus campisalis]
MMKNRSLIILIWASQLFYVLFLPIWFTFFGLTVIRSEQSQSPFLSAAAEYIAGAYPVVLLAVIVLSWSAYRKRKLKKMILINTIPILWIAPILITFLVANVL